jgi:hypothetical protein
VCWSNMSLDLSLKNPLLLPATGRWNQNENETEFQY